MNKKSQNSFEWSAEDPGNSRRQEALLRAHPALRTPHSTLQRASSRRLLLRLALGLFNAGLGCATPAAAQTNCSACWTAITNWQGSFTLSVSGGPQGDGWSGQVNNTSQGTFWITNGTHGVHGTGSISSSAEHAGCCGSGCATYYASCNTAASGALDAFARVGVKIDSANCSYSLLIGDSIGNITVDSTGCGGSQQQSALGIVSCDLAQPVGTGLGILPYFPLPSFGEHLSGSGTFTATTAATGCQPFGQFTLSLTWDIQPVVDSSPPQITQQPPGGLLGCNPTNTPDVSQVLDGTSATASSGQVCLSAASVDLTNGCTITRTFNITATDCCSQAQAHAVVAYWWTVDTTPPVLTSAPAGGSLGCNPANPPTDSSIQAQVVAIDNCGVASISVSHTDTTNGCALTRTFTITVTDNCGNVSPASTVAYTWTADKTPPTFSQLPPGGYLGTNPPTVPDDGAARGMTVASDNCGVASISVSHVDTGSPGLNSRTFTLSALDNCGNAATASVVYTWSGTAGPGSGPGGAPTLSILCLGTNVVLSWPTNAAGFSLQARNGFAAASAWGAVSNVPAVVGNQFMVSNVVVGPSRMYRLIK